jgi:hypothetical protein
VSYPGGERPWRSRSSSPSSSTTPRTSRASPVGAARPPSDRAISFEAVFAASRSRVLPLPRASPPADLTSWTSGDPQGPAQPRHAAQADGAVEIPDPRVRRVGTKADGFFTRTTRPISDRAFSRITARRRSPFPFRPASRARPSQNAGGAITTALSPSAWTTTRTLCGATS